MLRRTLPGAIALVGLVLSASACCHVNRLAALPAPVRAVSVEAESPGQAFLDMERRADRAEGVMMRHGGGGLSNVFSRYHRAVESLGDPRLAEALTTTVPAALDRALGWAAAEGDGGALLRVVVDELLVIATDPSASVKVRWKLTAELRDARGELIWRDCLEHERPVAGLSLDRIGVADDEERGRVQAALAREMADALARRLLEESRPAPTGGER